MISFSRLPVGFRFRPTDEELVDHYLKNKVQGMDFHAENIIDEIDILKFEPWDLVEKSLLNYMQRDFVLCHLKKNVNKSDEIHTDVATTCDEGEPTHNASDFENLAAHDTMDILEMLVINYDHNLLQAEFAANDSDAEFAKFLQTVIVEPDGGVTSDTDMEPFHGHGQAEMLGDVLFGSSQSRRDTGSIFRNQFSRQAAASFNVAPKPQTGQVQIKPGTSQEAHKPRQQSGPIIDTSVDEYYTKEKTRRRTYPPEKPKQPAYRRTAADLPQKQTSQTNSSQDKKVAQGKNAEKGMEQTQNRRTLSNWKRSFITWQTSPLTTSPPAACISKTFLSLYLFWFFVRRVVLYGE